MQPIIFLLTVWVNSSEPKRKGLSSGENLESLLADVLQIPIATVTDELSMKDLEAWDSLKHMELIATLENQLDIQLTF